MRKKIINRALLFGVIATSFVSYTADFKLINKANEAFDVVLVTGKDDVQPAQPIGKGGTIARAEIPEKIYISPKSWNEAKLQPATGKNAYVEIRGIRKGKLILEPQKGARNNLATSKIKIKANTPPPATPQRTGGPSEQVTPPPPSPPSGLTPPPPPPAPPAALNKDEWTKLGLKNGWFAAGSELPQGSPEDLQKVLDKEALEKLLERVSKEAKVDTKKLPVIKEAITAFWEDAGRGQKTSLKLLPLYIFKALEEGDDVATVAGMIGLWMGMPENARDAWRGEKPEKIGAFLEERVRLSKLLVIPTKPDTPEKITPPVTKKDTRPLEQQAKDWDEERLRREINKRNFSISGGPFGEKDPKKIETIEEEIKLLETIRDSKK